VRWVTTLAVIAVVAVAAVEAQRGRFFSNVRMATPEEFDSRFQFCRVAYGGGGRRGSSWATDFPDADTNLSIRLSELTRTPVSFNAARDPKHYVVRLTDDALFQCPFLMATEVGSLYFEEDEIDRLRSHLLKGGLLWVDDFWGNAAWAWWESQIRRVFPSGQYPIVDLPLDHPMFRMQFVVQKVAQIPSINYWMGSGGDTSERGYDSQTATARAILDEDGRVMVLMTHNTDFSDSWEREGEDPNYFYTFAIDGYAFGINVVLYSMAY
jgi:hypothetical protein